MGLKISVRETPEQVARKIIKLSPKAVPEEYCRIEDSRGSMTDVFFIEVDSSHEYYNVLIRKTAPCEGGTKARWYCAPRHLKTVDSSRNFSGLDFIKDVLSVAAPQNSAGRLMSNSNYR